MGGIDGVEGVEEPITGAIDIHVEAAAQGTVRYTLDPGDQPRVWHTVLVAHDDAVIGAATFPEQTAHLLVRGGVDCIRQSIPSLEISGLTMAPERGPNDNAQIVASGEARFRRSEWEAVKQRIVGGVEG